jgi:hypothetical protein
VEHRLSRYDRAKGDIVCFHHGLSERARMANTVYPGTGPVHVNVNGDDDCLYGGTLARIDLKTAVRKCLGKSFAPRRTPGLKVWEDVLLLGIVGNRDLSYVLTYDPEAGRFRDLGQIADTDTGPPPHRTHGLAVVGDEHTYAAETDVPSRSGHLWECELRS